MTPSHLPAPIASETELVELIADAIFTPATGYASQLNACAAFDRIADLLHRLTQEMIVAPGRVEAAGVKTRIVAAFKSESDRAYRDLDAYAREDRDERAGTFEPLRDMLPVEV